MQIQLDKKPRLERFDRSPVLVAPGIAEKGGMFGAGMISGVSLITTGEALGHEMWIDEVFIQQVAAAVDEMGVKSRFTHPGMSSDGLGRLLGRITNATVIANQVVGQLHFAQSARKTPEGDLVDYVSTLVSEDPKAAGMSIVFAHDYEAEIEFLLANGAQAEECDGDICVDTDGFKSPDPLNTKNYPHCRLKELRATDLVDEPAANPEGMFDSMPIAREIDSALSYALGLSKDNPGELLGVDCDRAAAFLSRFLLSRGLEIVTKDTTPEAAPITRETFAAELSRFTAKFGADNGVAWFNAGKTFEESLSLHCDALIAQRDAALKDAADAQAKLASAELGETTPLAVTGLETKKKKTLAEYAGVPSKN